MSKRPSLKRQVQEKLQGKLAIGESRHKAKADGTAADKIFSYGTYHSYLQSGILFTDYCKREHGCRYLDECRQYVNDYLRSRSDLSAWTQARDRSALAKLYECNGTEFIPVPPMRRQDIKRSRRRETKNFSEANNADIVRFAKGTGLRRHELSAVRGDQLIRKRDGSLLLQGIHGKGGKIRDVPVLPEYAEDISRIVAEKGDGQLFSRVPSHMPVHRYRSEYACAMYLKHARDVTTLPDKSVYRCRGDMTGVYLDREAMGHVSRCMGHNRISVIAQSYLYQLKETE